VIGRPAGSGIKNKEQIKEFLFSTVEELKMGILDPSFGKTTHHLVITNYTNNHPNLSPSLPT
jgi:hypothetical protein